MPIASRILTAPPGTGTAVRGRTLTSVLYDRLARGGNPAQFNQPVPGGGYVPMSTAEFARASEDLAFGLLGLGLDPGTRVALFLESDVDFIVADMACLIAGLVDVPIYRTMSPDGARYLLDHSEAAALVVTDAEAYDVLRGVVGGSTVRQLVVMRGAVPDAVPVPAHAVADVQAAGAAALGADRKATIASRVAAIQPGDTATILYTSGTTGTPKGVVLSHENISFNGLTAFSGLAGFGEGGREEVMLSFLPLTHIFARTNHYGALDSGASVYFCHPDELAARLVEVRPTTFLAVPRVLEKVYTRIRQKGAELTGVKLLLMRQALRIARAFDADTQAPGTRHGLLGWLIDRLVFSKWRAALGGRARYAIVGGAALSAELTNFFSAIGLHVLQGYGLTETSPVITYNRPGRNRAGTVGEPLPDVEVALGDDGEILTRGPHVMVGYYRDEAATAEAIDADDWFHTGDIGEITDDGRLRITDRKKDLFKLSTGKYVMPQPIEQALSSSPVIEHAVVVGAGQKFAAALLFPEPASLAILGAEVGAPPTATADDLVRDPRIVAKIQPLVDAANAGAEPWSTVKRFRLVATPLSIGDGTLTPKLSIRRHVVRQRFARDIAAMYDGADIGADLADALRTPTA